MDLVVAHNKIVKELNKVKNHDEFTEVNKMIEDYKTEAKKVPELKEAVERIEKQEKEKVIELLENSDKKYDSLEESERKVRNKFYATELNAENKAQINNKTMELLATLGTNENRNLMIFNECLKSFVGCRAILNILQYENFVNRVPQRIKEKALENGKTKKEKRFEESKAKELEEISTKKAQAYLESRSYRIYLEKSKTTKSNYFQN